MRRLLIFLKYPTPGRVKTRLARAIGAEAASAVARVCAERTLERLRAWQADATLCVAPTEAIAPTRAWVGPGWTLRPQRGRTLCDRLTHATREAFADGASRVVVVGTDSPWLSPEDIASAFDALERADVVLGPAEDGGYYLIGMSRPLPALFDGMAWSTASVYADTVQRARALGLHVHSLRRGYDIDQFDDLKRFLSDKGVSCLS